MAPRCTAGGPSAGTQLASFGAGAASRWASCWDAPPASHSARPASAAIRLPSSLAADHRQVRLGGRAAGPLAISRASGPRAHERLSGVTGPATSPDTRSSTTVTTSGASLLRVLDTTDLEAPGRYFRPSRDDVSIEAEHAS
jgi:hypothetical protein